LIEVHSWNTKAVLLVKKRKIVKTTRETRGLNKP